MRNTAAPYKVHHREHGTGKYPQQTEVIYEPIGVIGAAQYLLPGWERKHKLMTVVCQHQAEQYHRKYKITYRHLYSGADCPRSKKKSV